MRVVVYAEGGGEVSGHTILPTRPGDPLTEDELGPAHHLVRRCMEASVGPTDGIEFEAPLRFRGRLPKGSDLLEKTRLRQLLTWPLASRRPDLAVVLVDSDGDHQRRGVISAHVEGLFVNKVVGVAHQAFEAWLVADHATVGLVLWRAVDAPSAVETIPAGEVKKLLRAWIHETAVEMDEKTARVEIACRCDLSVLSSRCHSFELFCKELSRTLQ